MWDAETVRRATILTLLTSEGSIDLLGETPGVPTYSELKENARQLEVYGLSVRVASINDLLRMKKAADRPKDRLHIMELESLKRLIDQAE